MSRAKTPAEIDAAIQLMKQTVAIAKKQRDQKAYESALLIADALVWASGGDSQLADTLAFIATVKDGELKPQ